MIPRLLHGEMWVWGGGLVGWLGVLVLVSGFGWVWIWCVDVDVVVEVGEDNDVAGE